ncbi:MAG: copper amine oxidase, partial [Pseudoclavibacter sp.]
RTWHIGSKTRTNYVGKPTEYQLVPEGLPILMADPDSTVHSRANFATNHTWVSKYEPGELWPAGDYPNQHAGGAGLPAYTEAGESVDGGDIVLWHVFGPTHLPRTEDWPIMPVDIYRFKLKPNGFFDRNPALDVPDWSTRHAGAGAAGAADAGADGGGCCASDGGAGAGSDSGAGCGCHGGEADDLPVFGAR